MTTPISDDTECFTSHEQLMKELRGVEQKLALRHGIRCEDEQTIRDALVMLDLNNRLPEDELVADWHELMAARHSHKIRGAAC